MQMVKRADLVFPAKGVFDVGQLESVGFFQFRPKRIEFGREFFEGAVFRRTEEGKGRDGGRKRRKGEEEEVEEGEEGGKGGEGEE